MDLIKKLFSAEFVRFVLAGALNTAFGYILYAASYFLTGNEGLSLAIDYVVGALFNYKTYSILVFGKYNRKRFIAFCLVYVFTYFLNYGMLHLLIAWTGLNAYLSQLIALTVCPLALYFLLRSFVFVNVAENTA